MHAERRTELSLLHASQYFSTMTGQRPEERQRSIRAGSSPSSPFGVAYLNAFARALRSQINVTVGPSP